MIHSKHLTAVIPAYNEEKLIRKTIDTLPSFVDAIIIVDDCSKDKTLELSKDIAKGDNRVSVLHNEKNQGLGSSLVRGYKQALTTKTDLVTILAGDAQCDPAYLKDMTDVLVKENLDYVKANRFLHTEELIHMPRFRRIGNIFITLLTKFATGYYSIFDSQNGYGIYKRETLEAINLNAIGQRYDYENTLLIELSIINAKIKDVAVPAIYGEEVSTIPVFKTASKALTVLFTGFWKRIYYKYILVNFHPIALFLVSGIFMLTIGILVGLVITYLRIFNGLSPSTGTVMLAVIPFFLGFQLTLTALFMDILNEKQ